MALPAIELPKIDLPFDIPALIHPSVDHFAIVLPVIVLFIEIYNLFSKRKKIGALAYLLLIITALIFAAAYQTGIVDGKAAFDTLSTAGQDTLKEHKLLGTYLLLGTLLLLVFKALASTGKALFRVLYFVALIGFIVMTFEQGKDGGELVYTHGANVERVKILDDKLFDAEDALEDAQGKQASEKQASEQPVAPTAPTSELTPEATLNEVNKELPIEVAPLKTDTSSTLEDSVESIASDLEGLKI